MEDVKFSVGIGLTTGDVTTVKTIKNSWTLVFDDKVPSYVCTEEAAELLLNNLKHTITKEFLQDLYNNHKKDMME